jgi:hypothetical protein
MLRKKLRNNTILMRTTVLEGLLLGRSVLYISMINNATMEENNVICEVIIRGHDVSTKSAMHVASHQENH